MCLCVCVSECNKSLKWILYMLNSIDVRALHSHCPSLFLILRPTQSRSLKSNSSSVSVLLSESLESSYFPMPGNMPMHFIAPLSLAPALATAPAASTTDTASGVDTDTSVAFGLLCFTGMSAELELPPFELSRASFAVRFRTIPAKIDFCDGLLDALEAFAFGPAFSVLIFWKREIRQNITNKYFGTIDLDARHKYDRWRQHILDLWCFLAKWPRVHEIHASPYCLRFVDAFLHPFLLYPQYLRNPPRHHPSHGSNFL